MTYGTYEKTTYYIECDICQDTEEVDSCGEEWFLRSMDSFGWKRNEILSNGPVVDCCPHCKDLSDEEKIKKWEDLNGYTRR